MTLLLLGEPCYITTDTRPVWSGNNGAMHHKRVHDADAPYRMGFESPESNSHRIHVILYLKKHLFANGVVIIPGCGGFFVGGYPGVR